jgi:hypothetical protein
MKIAVATLFFVGAIGLPGGQEKPTANHVVAPSAGLEVGLQAPAFVLPDQFGRQQSNDTLKGAKGTVLLFFRSADW